MLKRRPRALTGLPVIALLAAFGCAQTAGTAGGTSPKTAENSDSHAPGATSEDEPVRAPEPPRSVKNVAYDSVTRLELSGGPTLCAAERPDLAQAFISLTLRGDLPPEEALLLREWLKAAWQNELTGEDVSFDSSACAGQFLCLTSAQVSAPRLLPSLLRVLAAPGQTAFYQARTGTLLLGTEWDRSSADWRLHTGARALRLESTATARLRALPQVDNAALLAAIERSSGGAKLATLTPAILEKQLARALLESTVVAAGPTFGRAEVEQAQLAWKGSVAKTAPPLQYSAAPSIPLRLEKHTTDLTQAALIFEFEPASAHIPVEKALTLLVLRWKKRASEGALPYVQPAHGIYSRPAIGVYGPHEKVLTTVEELTEEYDRLISAFGTPSRKEWEATELKRPVAEHFEPRCVTPPADKQHDAPSDAGPSTQESEVARRALRTGGGPTVVIWGTDTPSELAE